MNQIDHDSFNYLSIIIQQGSALPPPPMHAQPLYSVDKSLGTQALESVRQALEAHSQVTSVELQMPRSRRVKRDEL
ncbi:hypothetical protein E3P99_01005 [Wallemia hederae]|uniref:Uncharacterized protein n=1 Tax=Wallemia hederae TaxID=1540922 RepID=A0A4V4LTT4_9BASI|nr:hypothetical protein E3P99_01005 [Wallemia hederae]